MEQNNSDIDWDDVLRQVSTVPSSKRASGSSDNKQCIFKKTTCRYGRGCTHIFDPVHQERFTHPVIPNLDPEQIRNNYMCNECGLAFLSLPDLRLHLQRKTAWSNQSLLGCRISCLIDSKEWHEGIVTHFHRSGKHNVDFRAIGEKRWLNMTKMAFHILEQPPSEPNPTSNEYKENDDAELPAGYLSLDLDEWVYVEDISLDFAFAQSVLFKVFGGVIQETGHKTRGHVSLTDEDREFARVVKGSLLYGELLPRGVNKALGSDHLDAASHTVLYDLGMGTGKVLIQAFLQFRNLTYVYGIELSLGRYIIAQDAVLRMVNLLGKESFEVECVEGVRIVIREKPMDEANEPRILCMECGNMMSVPDIEKADIVMLETDVPQEIQPDLCLVLSRMHEGARTLTYHDIRKMWSTSTFPFKQFEVNRCITDRFPTSWSVQRGHHFFLWNKMAPSCANPVGVLASYPSGTESWAPAGSGDPTSFVSSSLSNDMGAGGRVGSVGGGHFPDEGVANVVGDNGAGGCLPFLWRGLGFGSIFAKKEKPPHSRHRSEGNEKVVVIPANFPPIPQEIPPQFTDQRRGVNASSSSRFESGGTKTSPRRVSDCSPVSAAASPSSRQVVVCEISTIAQKFSKANTGEVNSEVASTPFCDQSPS